jgi:hypothetical protein
MVADNAPMTIAAAKFAVQQALKDPADRDIAKAQRMVEACFASADHKEGPHGLHGEAKAELHGKVRRFVTAVPPGYNLLHICPSSG